MNNPFEDVPVNILPTIHYVMGIAKGGCEVYLPVEAKDFKEAEDKKLELQVWLGQTTQK